MSITTADLQGMIIAISNLITANTALLNQLDAATGDGDHGTGISIGFMAVAEVIESADSPADVLKQASLTLMNRMGGSSGALYGTLFLKAAITVKDAETLSPAQFAAMWQSGAEGVAMRGKSQPGDKTMLDALSPATETLKNAIDAGQSIAAALQAAADAAQQGADDTAQMQAKHGRARYVGERAIGHVDAGAQSIAFMFRAIANYWQEQANGET